MFISVAVSHLSTTELSTKLRLKFVNSTGRVVEPLTKQFIGPSYSPGRTSISPSSSISTNAGAAKLPTSKFALLSVLKGLVVPVISLKVCVLLSL
ncbi:MAG: hypothetical protein PVH88_19905 [Ignavibacteria bacterium]